MSMHEIEDLVEESVRLVLASDHLPDDRIATIRELYSVQGWFDTGDTTGRLADELRALGYVDARPLGAVALLRVAAGMMQEADAAGRVEIAQGWLALAIRAITDLDLTDEVPATFDGMLAEGDGSRMRAIALKGGLHSRWRKDFFMRVPLWGSNKTLFAPLDPDRLEWRFILRFLSDAKTDDETIRADYEAEKAKIDGIAALPLFTLPQRVPRLAQLFYLGFEGKGANRRFIFADSPEQPARGTSRVFAVIEHSNDLNLLTLEIRVQSGLLLAWQEEADNDIAATHFRLNAAMLVPEPELGADKDYNPFGGWPFRLNQSAKMLDARLAAIFSHWKHVERVRRFHATPLDRFLAESTPAAMEKRRRDLRGKYGFFLNDIELLFAYACLEWEKTGHCPEALIAGIENELRFVVDLYPLKRSWQEGLRRLREGPWFPPTTENFPYKRLEAP